MKKFENKNYNVAFEQFDSVTEFTNFIATRDLNAAFKRAFGSAERAHSNESAESFAGTKNLAEANELMRKGYAKGLKGLMETKTKLTQNTRKAPQIHADVIGFAPIVPNAIIGLPKSMMRREKIVQKTPVISILYNGGVCGGDNVEKLFRAGKNLMALVKSIEAQGYRVNLRISDFSVDEGQIRGAKVTIKSASQPLNPLLVSYPLTHASFYRRHMFAWIERSEITNAKMWTCGYGGVLRRSRADLKKMGILDENEFYLHVDEAASADSLEALYKKIGLTK